MFAKYLLKRSWQTFSIVFCNILQIFRKIFCKIKKLSYMDFYRNLVTWSCWSMFSKHLRLKFLTYEKSLHVCWKCRIPFNGLICVQCYQDCCVSRVVLKYLKFEAMGFIQFRVVLITFLIENTTLRIDADIVKKNSKSTQKKDLIESKKMICLNDFPWIEEMICLNEIEFVRFKQNIFELNRYLFESN